MGNSNNDCLQVGPGCPVQASIYGYYPSLGANAAFIALFLISGFIHVFQGLHYKTPWFMWMMIIGCFGEATGYGGRVMLHSNPFSDSGFKLQIVLLIICPAFIAAGLYVLLQRLIIIFGERHSRLPAKSYTWIFISCDFLSLVLQAAGGGISSAANTNSLLKVGNDLMIAGVSFQVGTLLIFILLAADFFFSIWRNQADLNPETAVVRNTFRFKATVVAIATSIFFVFCRCVYRVIEMAGGWANPIMQSQPEFIVLESLVILLAVFILNAFHPGYIYVVQRQMRSSGSSSEDVEKVQPAPKRRFGFGKK